MSRPRAPGQVRIIGGSLRGRKLPVPAVKDLRPTPDRTRETLFNWLGPLHGCRVLDLFAGSGALGLEAVSRGADEVLLLEQHGATAQGLREQARAWGLQTVTVVAGDALLWLGQQGPQQPGFDVVFLDPPFTGDLLQQAITRLAGGRLLASGARIYVEFAGNHPPPTTPAEWDLYREGRSRETGYRLYLA